MSRRRRGKLKRSDMDLANIGSRFFDVKISAIPDECTYKKFLEKYSSCLDENIVAGVGLLLLGDHDHGKTGAALSMLKLVLAAGYSGLFLETDRIQGLAIEKRKFHREMTWLERAELVDVLVLDDLGIEHTKGFGKSLIEGLLRARHNKRRPTFITSNLDRKKLGERYGRGVDGLLRESYLMVYVKGKNWRDDRGDDLAGRFAELPKKPKGPRGAAV